MSGGNLSMQFKGKNGNEVLIEASRDQRLELAQFIRSTIDTDDDTLEDDACIVMSRMENLHGTLLSQVDSESPLVLSSDEFWKLTEVANAWDGYVFAHYSPEDYGRIDVKKGTVDGIIELEKQSLQVG